MLLARFRRITLDLQAAAAVDQAIKHNQPPPILPGSPAGRILLRGIPVAGAATGTSPGTDPLRALLDKERNHGRP